VNSKNALLPYRHLKRRSGKEKNVRPLVLFVARRREWGGFEILPTEHAGGVKRIDAGAAKEDFQRLLFMSFDPDLPPSGFRFAAGGDVSKPGPAMGGKRAFHGLLWRVFARDSTEPERDAPDTACGGTPQPR
jgi:hypothetical protein